MATHLRVAEEYQRVGVQDLALDHYTDALRLEPRNVAALEAGRGCGAMRVCCCRRWATRTAPGTSHPTSATVRNTLGTILERRGLCHEALAEYREALRLEPDAGWAQQNVTRLADTCT